MAIQRFGILPAHNSDCTGRILRRHDFCELFNAEAGSCDREFGILHSHSDHLWHAVPLVLRIGWIAFVMTVPRIILLNNHGDIRLLTGEDSIRNWLLLADLSFLYDNKLVIVDEINRARPVTADVE